MCECFVYIRCSSTLKLQTLFLKSLTMRKLYNGLKALVNLVFGFTNLSCMFLHTCYHGIYWDIEMNLRGGKMLEVLYRGTL